MRAGAFSSVYALAQAVGEMAGFVFGGGSPVLRTGGSDALGAAACQNAERGAQEPTRLCSHIHMLIYSDNELWGKHSQPAYSHQRVFLKRKRRALEKEPYF